MKHCFYRLTAAYNMRIVQVMGQNTATNKAFEPWHILFVCVAPQGVSSLRVSLYGSMGRLPVLPHLTQLSRKAYVCYHKPLSIVTR